MGQLPDLPEARRRLELALKAISYDRWVLGYLRGGWLQPIAASEVSRRLLRSRPLMPLARKALFEMRPLVVTTVSDRANEAGETYEWELDWPALLYAPIAEIGQRPLGLLVVGCRNDHWYSDDDVAYTHTLGYALAPLVAALRWPLSRLNESEVEVVQLLCSGLSTQEIARAIKTNERQARSLVASVNKKLESIDGTTLMTW